jgi:hypothetical protein
MAFFKLLVQRKKVSNYFKSRLKGRSVGGDAVYPFLSACFFLRHRHCCLTLSGEALSLPVYLAPLGAPLGWFGDKRRKH